MFGGSKETLPTGIQYLLDILTDATQNPEGAIDAGIDAYGNVLSLINQGVEHPILMSAAMYPDPSMREQRNKIADSMFKGAAEKRKNYPEWLVPQLSDEGKAFHESIANRTKESFGEPWRLFEESNPNEAELVKDIISDPSIQMASMFAGTAYPMFRGVQNRLLNRNVQMPDIPDNVTIPLKRDTAKVGGKQEGQIFPWVDAYVRTKDSHPELAAKIDKYGTMAQNHLLERRVNEMTKKPVGIYQEIAEMTDGHIQAIEVGDDIELVYETDESDFVMAEPSMWDHQNPDSIRNLTRQMDNLNSETVMMDRLMDDPENASLREYIISIAQASEDGSITSADIPDYLTPEVREFIKQYSSPDYDISMFRPEVVEGGEVNILDPSGYTFGDEQIFINLVRNMRADPYLPVESGSKIDRPEHIKSHRSRLSRFSDKIVDQIKAQDKVRSTNLGQIWGDQVDDMEMFQILPELKKLGVRMKDTGTHSGGHFSPWNKEAVVNSRYNWDNSDNVMTHETGHAIANQTGQPQGSSSRSFSPSYPFNAGKDAIANNANRLYSMDKDEAVNYVNDIIKMHMHKYGGVTSRPELIDYIEAQRKIDPNFDATEARVSFEQAAALSYVGKQIRNGLITPKEAAKTLATDYMPANRQYMDTQGELSARVEEDRRWFSREDRKNIPYNDMLKAKSNVRPELRHLNYDSDPMIFNENTIFNPETKTTNESSKVYWDKLDDKDNIF